MNNRSTS